MVVIKTFTEIILNELEKEKYYLEKAKKNKPEHIPIFKYTISLLTDILDQYDSQSKKKENKR